MSTTSHETTAAWLACPECRAPLDAEQRYCVGCGARQAHADNPAARWFGAAARRRHAAVPAPAPRRGVGIGVALVIALLPLAVGGGVLIGRAGGGDAHLLAALKGQKPTVVNVGGGAGGGAGSAAEATPGAGGAAAAASSGVASGGSGGNAALATGIGGTAHSVVNHKATATTRAHDGQIVKQLAHAKGQGYIGAQQSLPDVIDVPSEPGAGSGPAPAGAGD
jgi:hypothetical protein